MAGTERASQDGVSAPLLLTVEQAAAMLAIGRTTAYELIAAGRLEVVRIGRCTRVPADAVARLVADLRRTREVG
jgi:excisionase family DNA binding protein